jgi:hypothetical protein
LPHDWWEDGMTERVLGPTGGRRRKRVALLVPFLALGALILAISASAAAISDAAGFQGDDGNLDPAIGAPASGIDWNSFAPVTWTGDSPSRVADKTFSGWEFKGLEDAQNDSNDSVFAGGVKQDDNCASVKSGPKPPNKDDLKRAYVASAVVGGKTYVALAWERIPQNTTSSSAHVGFEFNQGSTACDSTGLVHRSAANGGDLLIVYDFEGGSALPVLKLLRWKTTGTCEQTNKAATAAGCWVFEQDLTGAGNAEARVNVADAADAIHPDAPPSDTLASQEFGEAIVDLTGAGVFPASPTSCFTLGKVFAVSRSSGNSGTAAMKDLVGPGNISISNCGQVIIRKVTVPAGDTTTSFGYTTNVTTLPATTTSPFSLKHGESNTINNVPPSSGRTVTEDNPSPLYALTSINCAASTVPGANINTSVATRTVTFSIAADEVLDCTFTNTRQKLNPTMDTAPWYYPNDKATVNANAAFTDIDGTVKFRLFDTLGNCTATTPSDTVGQGGLLYRQIVDIPDAAATSKNVNTSNTSIKVETSTIVYWLVEYSGDSNHFGRVSKCVEKIDATLTGDTGGTAP